MNKSAKIFTVSGIFFTLILGSLGHFFYEWSGNNYVVGLFFATNESVWEHIKLALFPIFISFLLYGLFARAHSNFFAAFFMAMLTVILFIPLAFYGYTAVAEKSIIFIDISIFVISVILAYLVSYSLLTRCSIPWLNFISVIGIAVIIICFMTFTYNPPDWKIFIPPVEN